MTMSNYPEHDKQAKVVDQSQAIGEFLEWLNSEGVRLMTWREDLTDERIDDWCEAAKYSHLHCDHWGSDDKDHTCCRCGKPFGYREVTGIKAWVEQSRSIMQLLADWAEIDLKVIEAEKRQMLAEIRAANEKG
jgi:hypothetical protein